MKILLTGKNGQVGWELERTLGPLGEVIALDRSGLDLAKPDEIVARVRECTPDVIVNAAGFTAVDNAEREPDLAMAINGVAPGILAEEARKRGALLIHYSTDYVFDGTKRGPYTEDDEPKPVNVYGATKLAGERAILAVGCRNWTLRTSWVYASRGKNFLLTIRRLATERPELKVVDDQLGAPTWARDIATATALALSRSSSDSGLPSGIYHLAAAGYTTWHEFAKKIVQLSGLDTRVVPIATAEYPTPAQRPKNSALDSGRLRRTLGIVLPPWERSVALCADAG